MKRFTIEDGKEKVFVQIKDLRFLDMQQRTPSSIKKFFKFDSTNINKMNEYFEFDDPDFIKYMHESYFIIDYDKFNNMSEKEISKEFDDNCNNIEKVQKEIKKLRKKHIDESGYNDALMLLVYYQDSIINFINEKRLQQGNSISK